MRPALTAAAATHSLACHSLACRRGRRLLFRGVDLALAPGTITWLRGTNGSGKTSLMRILAGLAHAEAGEVVHGAPRLYIGHTNALKDDLTLAEALAFHAELAGLDRPAARAAAALEALGLARAQRLYVRMLSQGQRRRGALARLALDDAPRTWILDEPFDALDAASVGVLGRLLEAHAGRGGATLLTSHQPVALAGAREFDLEPYRA
jgi:heme exporter protein A